MHLSKYPVIYNGTEYKVDIKDEYWACGSYRLVTKVYITKSLFTIFNRTISKVTKVQEYGLFQNNRIKWLESGDFISLAKLVIEQYESRITKEQHRDQQTQEGIQQWTEWDGRL